MSCCMHFDVQKTELIKNIEKLTFWAGDNEKLHFAKQELLSQVNSNCFTSKLAVIPIFYVRLRLTTWTFRLVERDSLQLIANFWPV